MASLFDTPDDIYTQQKVEAKQGALLDNPRMQYDPISDIRSQVRANSSAGRRRLGNAALNVGQRLLPNSSLQPKLKKAYDIKNIREEVGKEYQFGTDEYFQAVSDKLAKNNYLDEALRVQEMALAYGQKKATLGKTKKDTELTEGKIYEQEVKNLFLMSEKELNQDEQKQRLRIGEEQFKNAVTNNKMDEFTASVQEQVHDADMKLDRAQYDNLISTMKKREEDLILAYDNADRDEEKMDIDRERLQIQQARLKLEGADQTRRNIVSAATIEHNDRTYNRLLKEYDLNIDKFNWEKEQDVKKLTEGKELKLPSESEAKNFERLVTNLTNRQPTKTKNFLENLKDEDQGQLSVMVGIRAKDIMSKSGNTIKPEVAAEIAFTEILKTGAVMEDGWFSRLTGIDSEDTIKYKSVAGSNTADNVNAVTTGNGKAVIISKEPISQ